VDYIWEDWQLETLDNYILGFTNFNTQQHLANYLDKSLNAVKIRLTRRRKELEDQKRQLSKQEYIAFLANRFSMSSKEIAEKLNISHSYLLDELDELDCLECKESLMKGFEDRPISNDEFEIFVRLNKKGKSKQYIAHFLNRRISFIEELIKDYERI
jgi:DNA-binding MarR family transcriptional regulator